jgi:predicted CoA-substrate-specific enzyme activase
MITAGIDAGSRAIKVALFDADTRQILALRLGAQGVVQARLAEALFTEAMQEAGLSREQVSGIVATGYGRNAVAFAKDTITEITCHARGVRHLLPKTRTIIEIGGQDSKLIRMDAAGQVRDFAMNDRCAAGTGRFLEIVAERLEVGLEALGKLRQASKQPALISNMCVVFAETEIIGLLSQGTAPCDIAAGVQNAIASRIAAMAGRQITPPVCFTGGVALQAGMLQALEEMLKSPLVLAPHPQYTGALGAALLAGE